MRNVLSGCESYTAHQFGVEHPPILYKHPVGRQREREREREEGRGERGREERRDRLYKHVSIHIQTTKLSHSPSTCRIPFSSTYCMTSLGICRHLGDT